MSKRQCMIRIVITALLSLFVVCVMVSAEEKPLAPLIIDDGDIGGYKTIVPPQWYRPESLWNYINGGALPYLDYGVGDVVTWTGSLPPDNTGIVVDIYDMGSARNAFGIYSSERFSDYDFVDLGAEGYISESGAFFWKDRYYIKVFPQQTEPSTTEPYRMLAEELARRIPDGAGMPEIFGAFPADNRRPHSEAFIAKNVLGQDYLLNGFTVAYGTEDDGYQLVIVEAPDDRTASEWLAGYRAFIGEYGTLSELSPSVGDGAFAGSEDWYGLVLFARKGRYLTGSVGLDDRSAAVAAVDRLVVYIEDMDK